jgi:hypothetical protein
VIYTIMSDEQQRQRPKGPRPFAWKLMSFDPKAAWSHPPVLRWFAVLSPNSASLYLGKSLFGQVLIQAGL